MQYDRKKAIDNALDNIDRQLTNRRGAASFTTARTQGVTAIKASQNPSGSGGTVGRLAERDPEHVSHDERDTGDTLRQVQSYEQRMLGRTPRTSAHLVDADSRSIDAPVGAEEGNDQQTGSINKRGGESDDPSRAKATLDESSDAGQRELEYQSGEEGSYRGYTGQEHRPVRTNLKPIRHDMGKKIR